MHLQCSEQPPIGCGPRITGAASAFRCAFTPYFRAAAHGAQADAAEIEAQAKRRLADEYDAAQQRGEVAVAGKNQHTLVLPAGKHLAKVADLGLTHKQVHEARQIRNAEAVSPGIVRRTLDQQLA